jgi:hypothetical protein
MIYGFHTNKSQILRVFISIAFDFHHCQLATRCKASSFTPFAIKCCSRCYHCTANQPLQPFASLIEKERGEREERERKRERERERERKRERERERCRTREKRESDKSR